MNNVSRALYRPLLVSLVAGTVLLAGCGGGGGGASLGPSDPPVEPTAANAEAISSAVLRSALSSSSLLIILASELDESNAGILSSLNADFIAIMEFVPPSDASRLRLRPLAVRSVQPQAVFGPISEDCEVSGSVTFSGDVADNLTYTAGDTIRADYANCDDGNGYELNGRIDFRINSFTGDVFFTFAVDTRVTLTNLIVTTPFDEVDVIETWNGEFNMTADTRNAGRVDVTGTAEEAQLTNDVATYDLTDLTVNATLGDSPVTGYDIEFEGNVDGTQFSGGEAVASTPTALNAPAFGAVPTTGTIVVEGDTNTLEINVQNGVNVQLEVAGSTIPTTWAALLDEA